MAPGSSESGCCSIFAWRNDSLKNVGNGIARTQFHFQRDWKPISDGNSISNAVGSPLRGRNSISNAVGSPLRGRNSISNVIGRPFPTEIPFPTRLEAFLRGRNGISNVFGRLIKHKDAEPRSN